MWPRGRPPSQQSQGTPSYSVGFNQYPQYPSQGSFRSQNRQSQKPRRDRARPSHQYSYYSDDSLNSNFSNNTLTSRGRFSNSSGYGRGSGYINAPLRNLPVPRTQLNDTSQIERGRISDRKFERSFDTPGRNRNEPVLNYNQATMNRSNNRTKQHYNEEIQPSMYFCPKCGENYSSRYYQSKYAGKIPLILHCNHTMCQECVYQELKNYKVNCPTCLTDSTLTQEQTPVCQSDMQSVFLPNFYILGILSYYKTSGSNLRNLENIAFVSTETKKSQPALLNASDRCCFATCAKEATMFCPICEGIYCSDCCTVVHKSTKKLMSHEPVPRRKQKFSLMLENCGEHPTMQVEFFCKTCDLTACCYCVLDKHTDHDRVPLYHLTSVEMDEFKKLKKVAEKALKEILSTQKKTTRLTNFDTGSVRKDVCQYFGNFHAKLESLEKKLCDELENFKASNGGLDNIQTSLMTSAEQLKQLVAFNEDKIGDKKLNLRGALDKLRNVENIPRFLLNEDGQKEPVRFVVNREATDDLEEDFTIEKYGSSKYQLVTENELPQDYIMDVDDSDAEVEEAINAIIDRQIQSAELQSLEAKTDDLPRMVPASRTSSINSKNTQKHSRPKEPTKRKLDMERVDVQHINSMDSFFVQYKNHNSRLGQLNKDIENYVKMGGAQNVQEPHLSELYLALYVTESNNQKEQKWCRARLTEIKSGESGAVYEMFFIDYGKTQIVEGNRIRDIPALLAQKRPFAIECALYNPMSVNWNKKAHYSLAKILIGKDVYMMEKSQSHGVYEVDLMIASSDGGITSVTDILVHAHNSVEPINDDALSLDGSPSARKDGYFPILRVFPNSKKFLKNQTERVIIANVVDPYNIFVQMVQHQDAFKSMCHAIKKTYKGPRSGGGCIPIEGTYVLVEYKDPIRSNWHRAFIKCVDINSDKVHVLLVDWGLNVVVSSRNIRTLQECFTKLESQAVLIKLAHIAPYNKQTVWSPYAANFLQSFHQSREALKMVVQEIRPELEVALFDISGNVDICLNAMMVEHNLADSTGQISSELEWPQFHVRNPEFSEDDGLMSSLLKKVNEQADDDSEEEDLRDIKKRQVDVIKTEAPDLIWVKFLEFRERESSMFKELQIHYSQEQQTKESWKIDEQCVTEIGHEFVRGKILEIVGDQYKIYLLDKVKEVISPLEKIYVYDKYFAKYPQAATKSHLANIRPAGDTGKWSISSVEALQQIFARHKRIYANKAPETDSELSRRSLPLDMWYGLIIQGGPLEPDRMKHVSINNSLVKLGVAYKIPRPVTSSPVVLKAATGEDLLKSLINDAESKEASGQSTQDIPMPDTSDDKNLTKIVTDNSPEGSKSEKKVIFQKPKDEEEELCGKKSVCAIKQTKEDAEEITKVVDLAELEDGEKAEDNLEVGNQEVLKEPVGDEDPIRNWNEIVEQELGNTEVAKDMDCFVKAESPTNDEPEKNPSHKHEVAIDDWLPPFRLTKNELKARVTCVETGGHLYLHEEATDDVYYTMEATMKEYFNTNLPEITKNQWSPGDMCTIKFTDGNWYRGKVLKIKSPEEISVFMIDFGSDHNLSPDVLFREVLYTDIGSFATKVKLDKIYPRSGSWLTSDYDHFHELVTNWCRIVVKGPLDVGLPLVEVYNEEGVCVNQKLVELCPNLSRCPSFPIQAVDDDDDTVVIESVESEKSYIDEMLLDSFNRELDIRATHLEEACSLETLKYKSRSLPEEFLKGKMILMEIGGVMSFDKLALRIPGEDVSEEMYDLITDLQDAVDYLPNLKEFSVGTPCIAPFSEDGVWYRARVMGTRTTALSVVDVFFVDYGNSEAVPKKNIRAIRPDYLKLPQQCWEASVNVVPEKDADMDPITELMNSLERKKKFVKLVRESPLIIDLYEKNEKLCYEALISSGALSPLHEEGEKSE